MSHDISDNERARKQLCKRIAEWYGISPSEVNI